MCVRVCVCLLSATTFTAFYLAPTSTFWRCSPASRSAFFPSSSLSSFSLLPPAFSFFYSLLFLLFSSLLFPLPPSFLTPLHSSISSVLISLCSPFYLLFLLISHLLLCLPFSLLFFLVISLFLFFSSFLLTPFFLLLPLIIPCAAPRSQSAVLRAHAIGMRSGSHNLPSLHNGSRHSPYHSSLYSSLCFPSLPPTTRLQNNRAASRWGKRSCSNFKEFPTLLTGAALLTHKHILPGHDKGFPLGLKWLLGILRNLNNLSERARGHKQVQLSTKG